MTSEIARGLQAAKTDQGEERAVVQPDAAFQGVCPLSLFRLKSLGISVIHPYTRYA